MHLGDGKTNKILNMDSSQKNTLESKKRAIQAKIAIDSLIQREIVYHWLDYYKEMLDLGMQVEILYLHQCSKEEIGLFKSRIEVLENELLKSEDILLLDSPWMDKVFNRFPTTSQFKYEIDAPRINPSDSISTTLETAAQQLNIHPTEVIFLSNDFAPVVQLKWSQLLTHSDALFDDGGRTTLIFTDPKFSWIILRTIEEDWFYTNL